MSALRLALLVVAFLAAGLPAAAQLPLRYRLVNLIETEPGETRLGPLEYMGGFQLVSDDPAFGGLSGLALAPDGRRIYAVSDMGHWWSALLGFDKQGRLDGIAGSAVDSILAPDGKPLATKPNSDAEALAVAPDGSYAVAFERRHRIWRYGPGLAFRTMRPQPMPTPPGIEAAPANGGIEAMAFLEDGRLFAIAEELHDANGDFQAWIMLGAQADLLGIAPTGRFKPTDAARLPSGDILLLERRYATVGGFVSRLSLVPKGEIVAGARLRPREIAVLERPYIAENFEGVAVAPDPTAPGHVRVFLVSDDNFHPMQRTLLLMFRMRDDAARR